MLDRCCRAGVKKVIFTSSGGPVYGLPRFIPITEDHPTEPICSYGISKLMIEKYLHMFNYLHGLNYQVLRISNPYGPYHSSESQGAADVFLSRVQRGEPIEIWGDGSVCRDYVYIDDVIDALYLSLLDNNEKVLNIGSGSGTTLNSLVSIIRDATGEKFDVIYKEGRNVDIPINVLSIERAAECYGWKPKVDLHRGIEMTWKWLVNERRETLGASSLTETPDANK
jgi:UDP-glucose 4-epimerase